MSRTKRIYNRDVWRRKVYAIAYRHQVDDWEMRFMDDQKDKNYPYWAGSIFVYHPYKQVCMGHCDQCKQVFIKEKLERERTQQLILKNEIENAVAELCMFSSDPLEMDDRFIYEDDL